jgi:uncharacterized membrane protein (DUF4010 family)
MVIVARSPFSVRSKLAVGALVLAGFFAWVRSREQAGKEALLSTGLFRNLTSNLGLVTQNVQWAMLLVRPEHGTQAVVAAVAAEYGIPFVVVTAGTRNHR